MRKKARIAMTLNSANSFETIAEEYIETKMVREGAAMATVDKAQSCISSEILVPGGPKMGSVA